MLDLLLTYSGYILAAAGFLFGWVQQRRKETAEARLLEIRRRHEENAALQARRFEMYKDYLLTLDSIHRSLAQSLQGEDIQKGFQTMLLGVFENPDDEQPIQDFYSKMMQFLTQWGIQAQRAIEEMNGLRLVCSPEMLPLLDEYSTIMRQYISQTGDMLGLEAGKALLAAAETGEETEWHRIGKRLEDVRQRLEHQMRVDIGVAS
jgi:hypothetical protein